MAQRHRIRPEAGMIHYQLRCDQSHEFDGWFNDSAGFEKQAKRGLIECPACGTTSVTRALMAPAVSKRASPPAVKPATAEPEILPPERPMGKAVLPPMGPPGGVPMPAQMVAMLQRMRAEVEKHCDYVGSGFAEEARKMHRGEAERRGIYGETTPEDAEALSDEGIEIHSIPWVPPADG
jgi:hypothetical protein